jgi:hypothetical protein
MGKAAHERAVQCYDWSVVMTTYQSLWHSLREKRLAPEHSSHGPIPVRGAVDRPDPFDLFSGYSTHILNDESRLHLCRHVDQAEFNKTMALSVHKFAALMLPTWIQAEKVLSRLSTSDTSVNELLSEVDFAQHSRFRLHLMWMMKVGWLTVA